MGDYGLFGLIILALDIYAIWNILKENWSGLKKVVWIVVVLAFPIVGMAVYFLIGRDKKA
ncbi:MAG: PLDc_N domain-containing protein [Alphaproteobacteria bacterium]|nr:PLDc_N domain-containing protein [Alphaproteobacteria bacterium]